MKKLFLVVLFALSSVVVGAQEFIATQKLAAVINKNLLTSVQEGNAQRALVWAQTLQAVETANAQHELAASAALQREQLQRVDCFWKNIPALLGGLDTFLRVVDPYSTKESAVLIQGLRLLHASFVRNLKKEEVQAWARLLETQDSAQH